MASDNKASPTRGSTGSNGTRKSIDLNSIREILGEDKKLLGICDSDINWFLRDPSVQNTVNRKRSATTLAAESPKLLAKDDIREKSVSETPSSHSDNTPDPHYEPESHAPAGHKLSSRVGKSGVSSISEEDETRANMHDQHHQKSHQQPSSESRRHSDVGFRSRRGSTASTGSLGSSGGFFSKIKDKLTHRKDAPLSESPVAGEKPSLFKDNYDLKLRRTSSSISERMPNTEPRNSRDFEGPKLSRYASTPPASSHERDESKAIDDYVKFYAIQDRRNSMARKSTINQECLEKYDLEQLIKPSEINKQGKLSSLLKRHGVGSQSSSQINDKSRRSSASSSSVCGTSETEPSENDPTSKLHKCKDLKRVAFHSLTFLIDPPQQIPARNPRKGNVEALPGGGVKVHALTDEEKTQMKNSLVGKGGGIVVGGTGPLRLEKKEDKDENSEDESDPEAQENGEKESESTDNSSNKGEEDYSIDAHAKEINIDTPMSHHKAYGTNTANYSAPVEKMALDSMYTRCCHLREILPIPAIAKQIPPNSMAPIPLLQLKNQFPTMIEIQSFADFVRIAPIMCVSLDGINLSLEQFRILLSAMCAKTQLEKISLRNTPINKDGWSLLCWFLSKNKVLKRLDITQCPQLTTTKKRKRKEDDPLVRMTSNIMNRSDMDWSLFTATIVFRGGIEEIILTGCCIEDPTIFEKFMDMAALIKTNRLGFAYNNLSTKNFEAIQRWILKDFARGLDLGYNDFLSPEYMELLLDIKRMNKLGKDLSKSSLAFFSMNSCNLQYNELFEEVFETILMKFPNLKYLDFSNNSKLFSDVEEGNQKTEQQEETEAKRVSFLSSHLPLFPSLIRLHLEHDNLSSKSLVNIASVIPFCRNLGYLSLLGNKLDFFSASALTQGLKNSKSLITLDCDYDDVPDYIREKASIYTMRNMESMLHSSMKFDDKQQEDYGSLPLTDQLDQILALKAELKLGLNSPLVTSFVKKASNIRSQITEMSNELLALQLQNKLNMEGKEALIRMFFISSSIQRGLTLIDPSLADNTQELASHLVAEDEKNKIYSQGANENNGSMEEAKEFSINEPHVNLSRKNSRTSLNSLDIEEGSMMKLQKLKDYHFEDEPSETKKWEDLSGEEIRQRLLNIDMNELEKAVDYLSYLKSQNVSLKELFNLKESDSAEQGKGESYPDVDALKKRIEQLARLASEVPQGDGQNKGGDLPPSMDPEATADDFKEVDDKITKEMETSENKESLNETYDQVLSNFSNLRHE